jgi:hypothetical protein
MNPALESGTHQKMMRKAAGIKSAAVHIRALIAHDLAIGAVLISRLFSSHP